MGAGYAAMWVMMSPEKCTDTQKERAEILFREFPDIKTAFSLSHSLLAEVY